MTVENKYSRGKIYKLVNNVDDEFYVGSTTQSLAKRKGGHVVDARHQPERNVYKHLNEIGLDEVQIILVENYPCQSIHELKARERYWIDQLKPSLNKCIPFRTRQEYYQDNKDKLYERQKEYREDNKDKLHEIRKEYNKANKDKIRERQKEYREDNKDKIKEYKEVNKDKIYERTKEYNKANKDRINEQRRERYAMKKAQKQIN
jgi:hypothetical protein